MEKKKKPYLRDYNKSLKEKARQLRRNSTRAEIRIWSYLLKAKKMKGYAFLRQRPILNYIADFYCKKLNLVIEIDGWTHEDEEVRERDKKRQKALEDAGYFVHRFTNYEVFHHLHEVKTRIENWIEKIEQ